MSLAALSLVLAAQAAPQSSVLWTIKPWLPFEFDEPPYEAVDLFANELADNGRLAVTARLTFNSNDVFRGAFVTGTGAGLLQIPSSWSTSSCQVAAGEGTKFAGSGYFSGTDHPSYWSSPSMVGQTLSATTGESVGRALGMTSDSGGGGFVVGELRATNNEPSTAFIWSISPTFSNAELLKRGGYQNTFAEAINSSGKIVGRTYDTTTFERKPIVWETMASEPSLVPGWAASDLGQAWDVNSPGSVAGIRLPNGSVPEWPFIWTAPGGLKFLGLAGQFGDLRAINDTHTVVGSGPSPWVWIGDVTDPYEQGNVMDLRAFLDPEMPFIDPENPSLGRFPFPEWLTGVTDGGSFSGYLAQDKANVYVFTSSASTKWTRYVPTTLSTPGTLLLKGDLASLGLPDGDYMRLQRILPFPGAPEVTRVEVTGTIPPTVGGEPAFYLRLSSRVNASGTFTTTVSLYDYSNAAYVQVGQFNEGTRTTTRDFAAPMALERFRGPNDTFKAKVETQKFGISTTNWVYEPEQLGWIQSNQ